MPIWIRKGHVQDPEKCKIGLRLSRVLFLAVLELISMKTVMKDAMNKLLYANDLALVTNGKQELHDTLDEWNGLFTRYGVKLSLERRKCCP